MAARQPRRPDRRPCRRQRDADVSATGLRTQAGAGRDRARVRLDKPDRRLEPPAGRAGAWMPGRSGPTASSPGKRWATPNRGTKPTNCRSFTRAAVCGLCVAAPIPSIRLKAYRRGPAGRRVPDALVAAARTSHAGLWAASAAALKLAGTRQGTGFTGGEDAGRIDYGRLRPAISGPCAPRSARPCPRPPCPKSKLVDFRTPPGTRAYAAGLCRVGRESYRRRIIRVSREGWTVCRSPFSMEPGRLALPLLRNKSRKPQPGKWWRRRWTVGSFMIVVAVLCGIFSLLRPLATPAPIRAAQVLLRQLGPLGIDLNRYRLDRVKQAMGGVCWDVTTSTCPVHP